MNVDLLLAHRIDGVGKAGDRVSVPESDAGRYIRSGRAVPATVKAAKELNLDPDTAATKRSGDSK